LRKNSKLHIAIIEPSENHYYQPAWTMVGGGVFDMRKTIRKTASVIPEGVKWIREKVVAFIPEKNIVVTDRGNEYAYDYLVVSPGIQLNWNAIKGLPEALGKNGICSVYDARFAPYTFECISNLKSGKAIFTAPNTPVKCGGAPMKIMFLASDYFGKNGTENDVNIHYFSGGKRMFAIDDYEKTLLKVAERYHIHQQYQVKLVEVDGINKTAHFEGFGKENKGEEYVTEFEMLHVTPPQSAPDFIRNSPLSDEKGWV